MRYITNVALQIRGDRVEKGAEIELSDKEAKGLDPADITPVSEIPEEEPEIDLSTIPLEEMDFAQLKARAKELELSASGSKADIAERIRLHLEAGSDEDADEETSETSDEDADEETSETSDEEDTKEE